MYHAEPQRAAIRSRLLSLLRQRRADSGRIAEDRLGTNRIRQFGSQGDRIAIEAEHEWRSKLLWRSPDAHGRRDGQRREHVRGIGMAIEQSIEHGRPGDIARQCEVQPLLFRKSQFPRQNRQAGIDQRQESNGQFLAHRSPFISSCAVTTASAIAAIRLFESIALRRNSA